MRQEIEQALHLVETVMQAGMQMLGESPTQSGDLCQEDAQKLTDQLAPYHKQATLWYNQLSDCFRQHIENGSIEPFSSTSLIISFRTDRIGEVIVEITPFGSFVAVYSYGSIPEQVLECVNGCISQCGLMRLTEQEVDELMKQGHYYHLF